jgi:hypothetical protein
VCDSVPGFRASESFLPPSPGYCEAPVSLPGESRRPGSRHRRCGAGLARASTLQIPAGHPVLAAQQVLDELIDGDTASFGLYEAAPQATITALADLRAIAGRVITHALHREIPGDMAADHVTAELHRLARQQQASQHAAQHRVGAAPPMTAASALGLSHAVQVMTSEDAGTAAGRLRWLTPAAGPGRLPTYASGLDDWGRSTSDVLRRAQLAALGPNLRPGDQLRYRSAAPAPAVRPDATGVLARARRHAIHSVFCPPGLPGSCRGKSATPACGIPPSQLPCSWPAPGSPTLKRPGSSAA